MRWVAPSEKDTATATLEKRLRANFGLKSEGYCGPILRRD
jgi:hypothetical protein